MAGETVYSFASGQTPLPTEIIEAVEADILNRHRGGLSLLELPFTCDEAREILRDTELGIRELLGVPDTHEVLFLQGGAYAQFGILAMNLGGPGRLGAYVETGHWSRRAAHEAKSWIEVHRAAQGDGTRLPPSNEWHLPASVAYCHFTSNESADGLQYHAQPELAGVPLVVDMTADFLTRPLDVGRFALIYASSQKNLGIAGLTVIVIAKSLVERCAERVPAPFHYGLQVRERSKVNTPPLFAIAVAGHVCKWLAARGGLGAAAERSTMKAQQLYGLIEEGGFYNSPIDPASRSQISVRFHLPTQALEAEFLAQAQANGLLHLKGHPDVGGLRASLYNLVALKAVEVLADFMREFRRLKG